jgi:hypothetical protein
LAHELGVSEKTLRYGNVQMHSMDVRATLATEDTERLAQSQYAAAPKVSNIVLNSFLVTLKFGCVYRVKESILIRPNNKVNLPCS